MRKTSSYKTAEAIVSYYAREAAALMRKQPMSLADFKQLKELREAAATYKGILAQRGSAAPAVIASILALVIGLVGLTGCAGGYEFGGKIGVYEIETRDQTETTTVRAKPFVCRFRQCDAAGNVVQGS